MEALDELEVQRFARQILLRDVGGRGQLALKAHPVAMEGGAAAQVAGAYLSAGGTPVDGEHGALIFARSQVIPAGVLVEAPIQPAQLPAVVVGGAGGVLRVLAAGPGACRACVAATLLGWGPVPLERAALGGTLAALAWQRLALGLGSALEVREALMTGEVMVGPPARCEGHRA